MIINGSIIIICVSIILSDVYSYTCACYKNVFLDVGVTL